MYDNKVNDNTQTVSFSFYSNDRFALQQIYGLIKNCVLVYPNN